MIARLVRKNYLAKGIFGELELENHAFYVAEHAYEDNGTWLPKVPAGQYTCIRRHSPHFGYDVFWLTSVPGCEWIEIHKGNEPSIDSNGCLLLGLGLVIDAENPQVTQSKAAFDLFMSLLKDYESFQLVIC